MSYGKIWRTTVAVIHGLLSRMPLVLEIELIHLWNSILPEPGQPSAQLFKLIRLIACKKTKHKISRWYRTVYIPRFVTYYDTHKGNRSDPPNHRRKTHLLEGTGLCTHFKEQGYMHSLQGAGLCTHLKGAGLCTLFREQDYPFTCRSRVEHSLEGAAICTHLRE